MQATDLPILLLHCVDNNIEQFKLVLQADLTEQHNRRSMTLASKHMFIFSFGQ